MNTSYFGKAKKLENAVAICTGVPSWFQGEIYTPLAPGWDIVMEYKNALKGHETIEEIEKRYVKRYKEEVLANLDPLEVYIELQDKVLLCYETSDKFCHRHIVAQWIFENLGFEVTEL